MNETAAYKQPRNLVKGRIVIYWGIPRNPGEPIGERPAIVLRIPHEVVVPDPPVADLQPFFLNDPATPVLAVPYSQEKLPNTWCWVDEQDLSPDARAL